MILNRPNRGIRRRDGHTLHASGHGDLRRAVNSMHRVRLGQMVFIDRPREEPDAHVAAFGVVQPLAPDGIHRVDEGKPPENIGRAPGCGLYLHRTVGILAQHKPNEIIRRGKVVSVPALHVADRESGRNRVFALRDVVDKQLGARIHIQRPALGRQRRSAVETAPVNEQQRTVSESRRIRSQYRSAGLGSVHHHRA